MSPRAASRLAWSLWGLALGIGALSVVFQLQSLEVHALDVYGYRGLPVVMALSFVTVGALIAARRPAHTHGWLFLLLGLLMMAHSMGQEYASYALERNPGRLAQFFAWNNEWLWVPWVFTLGTFGLLLFPDGHLPSRRWRPVAVLSILGMVVTSAGLALVPGPLEAFPAYINPVGIRAAAEALDVAVGVGLMLLMLALALSVASVIVRMRRAAPAERAQLRWFGLGGGLMLVALLLNVLETFLPQKVPAIAVMSAATFLPVALGIGILRYRALDIDVVIRKAVVYTFLAAAASALYFGVVVAVPTALLHPTTTGQTVITIVVTSLLTLALLPLRRRAVHLANRLVFGKRATPYEVLSEFSGRVGGAYSTEDVLPRMARALGEGTGAMRAEVQVRVGHGLRPEAAWPAGGEVPEAEADLVAPVTYQGDDLGALAVWKTRGDPVTPVEEKLVRDLASQAGLVLRNVGLFEDLRLSRVRLIEAQDAERRRLERDIHDGAQQHLVSLMVRLRLAETLIAKDPDKAAAAVAAAKDQAGDALETLRDLARGIYPPLLADQGLPAALGAAVRKSSLPVELHPDGIGRYPEAAEAAVYFCVLEALQNVAKYAEASRAQVRLSGDAGELRFEVEDDGRGFDPVTTPRGSGTQNMADRLSALGGSLETRSSPGRGTTVVGRVPVEGPR
jgi:signal transduction histidine kinase